MNDVIVRVMDMPYFARGFTLLDSDGDFNVYLNSRYTCEEQEETYRHEMKHIKNGDFYGDCPIELIDNL